MSTGTVQSPRRPKVETKRALALNSGSNYETSRSPATLSTASANCGHQGMTLLRKSR
jgi:hypothetical protein